MSEFKGTKGEWIVNNYNNVDSKHKLPLAVVYDGYTPHGSFKSENNKIIKANALLISKSPEMLEMLSKSLSEFDQCKDAIYELMEYQDGWEANLERVKEKIQKIEKLIKEATNVQ